MIIKSKRTNENEGIYLCISVHTGFLRGFSCTWHAEHLQLKGSVHNRLAFQLKVTNHEHKKHESFFGLHVYPLGC
jgi:hypothetical protein